MSVTATFKNNGFHPTLERDHPYIFIDSCMQAWPDADYEIAHRHGVTAYAVQQRTRECPPRDQRSPCL